MTLRLHSALLIVAAVAAGGAPAYAQRWAPDTTQDIPASVTEGVTVTEHLGAQVPRDTAFVDQSGKPTTFGDALGGDLPVLLTFNYSDCPQLCDLQLSKLAATIASATSVPGKQFRLVTVVLAPGETPARAARMRARYLARVNQLGGQKMAASDWTFLLSKDGKDDRSIHAIADAVGFGYKYIARQNEYAHPATLIVLTAAGKVSRYLHGIEPPVDLVDTSIGLAALSETASSTGYLVTCLHWNPKGRAALGASIMRFGALGFAIIVIAAIIFVIARRRSRHLPGVSPS